MWHNERTFDTIGKSAFEITVCLSASKIASRLPITDNTLTASGCY